MEWRCASPVYGKSNCPLALFEPGPFLQQCGPLRPFPRGAPGWTRPHRTSSLHLRRSGGPCVRTPDPHWRSWSGDLRSGRGVAGKPLIRDKRSSASPEGRIPRTSRDWSRLHSPGGPGRCQSSEREWNAHEFGEPGAPMPDAPSLARPSFARGY